MPEFHLDTSGAVYPCPNFEGRKGGLLNPEQRVMIGGAVAWSNLDAFTQGYVEALFFTSGDEPGVWFTKANGDGVGEGEARKGFSDLAPEALASIIEDCRKFQETAAHRAYADAMPETSELAWPDIDSQNAGYDFWCTRNGHGCGFWDGGWPEPYAAALTEAAKAFGECDVYLGDDGKVHIS